MLELWGSSGYVGEFNDFGVQGHPPGEASATGLETAQGGTMIVEVVVSDEPIGTVSWRAVRYGPTPESVAWQIGIDLIPEARGRGFGVEAQRLLARHLFATTGVNRIEAMTDVENLAEQRAPSMLRPLARFLNLTVGIAQLVERRVVVPVVAGSSPVRHPSSRSSCRSTSSGHTQRKAP